jgi:dihydroorotate dehydrogenase subfamily 1
MARTLQTTVNGIPFENPFLLGSGPPGTNAKVIAKSFDLGWGGVVAKTIALDASKVTNVTPRYGKLHDRTTKEVIGFQNIELISDRPFETWLDEFRQLKKQYPNKVLVASIMEEGRRECWHEIVQRVQETGVDAFELNLSCPHGLPERKMGMAMGEDPEMVRDVCAWVKEVATIPVWAKMTPNVGSPAEPARAAIEGGADGISAINTILSCVGVDLRTLRPLPSVEGHSVPGGYSGQAVRPIALRQVMEIARAVGGRPISGMGGVESGLDAAQFFLLGAHTVQVCTGAMLRGYEIITELQEQLLGFMAEHGFERIEDFRGKTLPYFTTHADLVERQRASREDKAAKRSRDNDWKGNIERETAALTSNER